MYCVFHLILVCIKDDGAGTDQNQHPMTNGQRRSILELANNQ
jgi:hypothetical protein